MTSSATGSQSDVADYSPIQKLPQELLSKIFHHCVSHPISRPGFVRLPNPSVREAPLKLGRISRSWRQLVLSDPLLWSRLSLVGRPRDSSLDLVAVGEWLARSQLAPLWLAINYAAAYNDEAVEDVNRIITKVISHSDRWKYLELSLPSPCKGPILTQLSKALPNLEFLHIHMKGKSEDRIKVDLSNQTSLKDLTLLAPIQFSSSHSAMRNIRTLRMAFPSLDEYFLCLDLCSSVEEVQYTFNYTIDFRPSISEPLRILPSIITFSLTPITDFHMYEPGYAESLDFGVFLDRLQLPTLRELVIDSSLWTDCVPTWSHASDLLKRSSAHLEIFKVRYLLHGSDFSECLRQSPCLKTLLIGSEDIAERMLQTLTEHLDSEKPFVCPQLQRIELDLYNVLIFERADDGVYTNVAELVVQRWHGGINGAQLSFSSPIRSVAVCSYTGRTVEPFIDYPGIRQCIVDGLVVTSMDEEIHSL
ncbi:hypothetical protein BD410DRAFT_899850 [Rickenella mellea]|uniref:Uncharacterized protein n=1 Tax=Rickenella mellea TaxID=50990 RepID=A0A4Y7PYC2_9AGAM|nr:hypothetical protein BD410DRAFT_899850 [Rickenella mellea]